MKDLRSLIDNARKGVAVTANATLTALYWQIGHRVRTEILLEKRAEYGAKIVATVGRQLARLYGCQAPRKLTPSRH